MATLVTLTPEQSRLMYLISLYSKPSLNSNENVLWLRQTSLRTMIFEGIRKKVFDWDYAPASVMTAEGRRFLNISQEGEDDINDLREMALITSLKLSTARHYFITAYCVTEQGLDAVSRVPEEDRQIVRDLVKCTACGGMRMAQWQGDKIIIRCDKCAKTEESEIVDIEDVSYISKAYIPRIPILRKTHGGV